jgi:2-oxoglutarate dehydrogenase E1 component
MIEAPVYHVNGDDPEAAVSAMRLALEYRQNFHKDVVIDLVCYRRLGHNEADEPAATQPLMYRAIRKHPTVCSLYVERLAEEGVIAAREQERMADEYRRCLDEGRSTNPAALGMIGNQYTVDWSRYREASLNDRVGTSLPSEEVRRLGELLNALPNGFKVHPRVQRIVEDRRKMATGELPMDWGFAECLAYASLLSEKFQVRLIGQDSRRGTFFHRHAAFHDIESGEVTVPLARVSDDPQAFTVADSLLSEEAVLGFEYGYSTTTPYCLVVWEAQFGDFANGAQVVIDQFISSGEAKWGRLSSLTLFLPHGYEGQGPEHSSARLERFLQLCAEGNMQVCVPSTPAQMFHLLRRQMIRSTRKPLIVMTPKSLLRNPASTSSLEELTRGGFRPLIDEVEPLRAEKIQRIVFAAARSTTTSSRRGANSRSTMWRSCASRSFTRSPARNTRARSRAIRTLRRSSGAKRSRRIRVRGTKSVTASKYRSALAMSSSTRGVPVPRHRLRGFMRCTCASRRLSSRRRWPPRGERIRSRPCSRARPPTRVSVA